LAGSLTVTVMEVQSNGNLVIQGEKTLKLNQGDEFVRVSGVVRRADIATDNTVTSDKVADAHISYSGRGVIDSSNRVGWLARFFNSALRRTSHAFEIHRETLRRLAPAAAVGFAGRGRAHQDLAQIQGVRTNQLVGYGLVVGLDSTGDQTSQAPFTVQSLNNMLAQLGVHGSRERHSAAEERGAVAVHAVMPAFVKPGQTIDITVNSIANAKSLRGGSLLVTPLHGLDGQIYAIAQEISSSAASVSKAPTDRSSP